jgi:hypothetical protein
LADGSLIIPIVADATKFTTLVPPQIAALNGISFTDCGAEFERLASRVLEGFGLLREKRRLFISYRRVETAAPVAYCDNSRRTNTTGNIKTNKNSVPVAAISVRNRAKSTIP